MMASICFVFFLRSSSRLNFTLKEMNALGVDKSVWKIKTLTFNLVISLERLSFKIFFVFCENTENFSFIYSPRSCFSHSHNGEFRREARRKATRRGAIWNSSSQQFNISTKWTWINYNTWNNDLEILKNRGVPKCFFFFFDQFKMMS